MREKLRRIESMHVSFEPEDWREELEPLRLYPYRMTDEDVKKGLEAEGFAKAWLYEKYGAEHVIDMTYPKRLTEINNLIVDALEGRECHNYVSEKDNPEKPQYWDAYRKRVLEKEPNRVDVLHIWSILKELELKVNDDRAKELIKELKERFKDLNAFGDDGYLDSLGKLKGTKFDFIAVNDGRDVEHPKGIIFFDAKWWDNQYETPIVNMRELEMELEFATKGIPFYLLFWNEGRRWLYACEIHYLPIKYKAEYYKIPKNTKEKKYLIPIKHFPIDENEH